MTGAAHPTWWELVRTLWPVLATLFGLAIGGVLLALANKFATVVALKALELRVLALELFKNQQETAMGILPSRQQLGQDIAATRTELARDITQTREELGEQVAELGERIAGLESSVTGLSEQGKTTNTYLHTLIERGLRQ